MDLGLSFIPVAMDPDCPGRLLLKLEHAVKHLIILPDHTNISAEPFYSVQHQHNNFLCHRELKLLAGVLSFGNAAVTLFNNRKIMFVVQCLCLTSDNMDHQSSSCFCISRSWLCFQRSKMFPLLPLHIVSYKRSHVNWFMIEEKVCRVQSVWYCNKKRDVVESCNN